MKRANHEEDSWTICPKCKGRGKIRKKPRKKVRHNYQKALEAFEKFEVAKTAPIPPVGHLDACPHCSNSGLVSTESSPVADNERFPHVAIIGGGIGGVALAVACLHRQIPFTLYERDDNFDARAQGYGLTLQQASQAMEAFGISSLKDGIVSTRHVVHSTDGKILGEWGMRKWLESNSENIPKRTNVHIARQSLRLALLEQLGGEDRIQWSHKLTDFKNDGNGFELTFEVDGKTLNSKADLVVGADGIRSLVRNLIIGEDRTPLRYLDCIVILGICPLAALKGLESPLLDAETVFQTANGNERIYMMPYKKDSVMWQLSFPMLEEDAKDLSTKGAQALKDEAIRRTPWHTPIPEIIERTQASQVSGYPVYDREVLRPELLNKAGDVTLIGDAAHPMSPFKGQGANQALLDALALARGIYSGCHPFSEWKKAGLRDLVLTDFETNMMKRSAIKVKDSADAAELLHSKLVLNESNSPRGRNLNKKQ